MYEAKGGSLLQYATTYGRRDTDSYRPRKDSIPRSQPLTITSHPQSQRGRAEYNKSQRSPRSPIADSKYSRGRDRSRPRSPDRARHDSYTSNRGRSRSPQDSRNTSSSDVRRYRSRSPPSRHVQGSISTNGRKLIKYDDIDARSSLSSPRDRSRECSQAHIARPRYVSMKEARPNDCHRFEKSEFEVGMIIRAPLHEEDVMRRSPESVSIARSYTPYGRSKLSNSDFGTVYSESRFFIVVEKFALHYVAIPLFTYSGAGLREEHDVKEYASIIDHRYPHISQRQAPVSLTTGELGFGVAAFKPQSVAHLTYAVPRKYDLHVAYQGKLEEDSTKKLVLLYRNRGK